MKKSQMQRLAEKEIRRLKSALGLHFWDIDLVIGRCETEGAVGENGLLPEYERATITIDHARIENEDELLNVVRHEMIHCLLAPMEDVLKVMHALLDDDKSSKALVDGVYDRALERTVLALERSDCGSDK